jgi:hypothetical protein
MSLNSLIKKIWDKFGVRSLESTFPRLGTGNSKLLTAKEVRQQAENQQIVEINQVLRKTGERLAKLEAELSKATAGYRSMLISRNPEILPELISGENTDSLDRSLIIAKELTEKVRQQIEKKTAAERIPGGAPVRAAPDTESMNSLEKIIYGLEKK